MEEKKIRNFRETVAGFFIFISDRFIAHIPTRHHQAFERAGEQQMMKGGIREHDAQGLLKRRNAWGNGRILFPVEEDNRSFRAAQEALLLFTDVNVRSHFLKVPAHDGKGLVLPELS